MSSQVVDQELEPYGAAPDAPLLQKPLTVLVVDDHILILSAIRQILAAEPEIQHIILCQDYTEAEEKTASLHPDIIWLDMHTECRKSIVEIGRLRELSPHSRIMALADVEDEKEAFAAIMAGAQGYRSKQDVDPCEIMAIIRVLCRGEFALRPGLAASVFQHLRCAAMPALGSERELGYHPLLLSEGAEGLSQLTTRECEILQLISQGYRDRSIAKRLYITEKTVQKHVQNILSKLCVRNRTEAAYMIHCRLLMSKG